MERTIKVTGKGKVSVKPDLIRLALNLEGTYPVYEAALEHSSTEMEQLRDCFEALGFERKALKTLSFHVDTEYESYQAEDKAWKQRFVGYKFHHSMKIEFEADNELLGRVLYALANAPVSPEFKIVYTVKNSEAAKNRLLGKAIKDSREKAEVLTKAAGVILGEIVTIDYSWADAELVAVPMPRMLKASVAAETASDSYNINIEPDNISVTDTVTVIWEIK